MTMCMRSTQSTTCADGKCLFFAVTLALTETLTYGVSMSQTHRNSRSSAVAVRSEVVVRKRYTEPPAILSIKLEAELMRAIDDEVLREANAANRIVPRSDVVKALIREALTARAKRRK
jgi:hypothetical protein